MKNNKCGKDTKQNTWAMLVTEHGVSVIPNLHYTNRRSIAYSQNAG